MGLHLGWGNTGLDLRQQCHHAGYLRCRKTGAGVGVIAIALRCCRAGVAGGHDGITRCADGGTRAHISVVRIGTTGRVGCHGDDSCAVGWLRDGGAGGIIAGGNHHHGARITGSGNGALVRGRTGSVAPKTHVDHLGWVRVGWHAGYRQANGPLDGGCRIRRIATTHAQHPQRQNPGAKCNAANAHIVVAGGSNDARHMQAVPGGWAYVAQAGL